MSESVKSWAWSELAYQLSLIHAKKQNARPVFPSLFAYTCDFASCPTYLLIDSKPVFGEPPSRHFSIAN